MAIDPYRLARIALQPVRDLITHDQYVGAMPVVQAALSPEWDKVNEMLRKTMRKLFVQTAAAERKAEIPKYTYAENDQLRDALRAVRGCATDEQYQETYSRVKAIVQGYLDQIAGWEHNFDMYHNASMRGAKMWRDAHPGNELVLPDTGKMVEWLLEQHDKDRNEIARLKSDNRDMQDELDGKESR